MKLHPFDECVTAVIQLIEEGHTFYQQFNCAKCGAKQTMSESNKMFTHGICEECGHETDIKHDGCNYMLLL